MKPQFSLTLNELKNMWANEFNMRLRLFQFYHIMLTLTTMDNFKKRQAGA